MESQPPVQAEPVASGRLLKLSTVSTAGGHYSFDNLPDGDYRVSSVNRGDLRSAWRSVRAGKTNADLVLLRDRRIVIHGTVAGDDDEPLEGVSVLPNMVGVASATTDSKGRYRLTVPLAPDALSFRVNFRTPGYLEKSLTISVAAPAGDDQKEVHVEMAAVETWTAVTGSVLDADGEPLPGRAVKLQPLDRRNVYVAKTDANGHFSFDAIEAGQEYQLRVDGGAAFPDFTRHVRIDVEDSDFEVVLSPFEYGELSGRLVNLEGTPVPDFTMTLRNSASRSPNTFLSSDGDGNFAVKRAPAGQIYFATRSSPSMVIRGVRLKAGDELEIPLVLDWGSHEIRGLVVDPLGNPIAGSQIALSWSHEDHGIHSASIRRTTSDAQGSFNFSALGPGPHRLEVDAPGRPLLAVNYDASREGYDLTLRMN